MQVSSGCCNQALDWLSGYLGAVFQVEVRARAKLRWECAWSTQSSKEAGKC